jgi:hypothetical protein
MPSVHCNVGAIMPTDLRGDPASGQEISPRGNSDAFAMSAWPTSPVTRYENS